MQDILIIGSGPAGVSAALYAVRAGQAVTVVSKGIGMLAKAEKIENYYGFEQPITGEELSRRAVAGAERLGVQFVTAEVVGIDWNGDFTVKTDAGDYTAKAVLLATGSARRAPKLDGIAEFEGKGVSYCATCDAFFYRGKDVAVLGAGEYAVHEAAELAAVAASVTLLTNGAPAPAQLPKKVSADTRMVSAVFGEDKVAGVRFADGEIAVSGVFVAYGVAGSSDLARKLGAEVNGTVIVTDDKKATNIPGLYAAGDCTGGLLQVSKAVADGAIAGTEMAKFVRSAQ